jgi:hypothetical protein
MLAEDLSFFDALYFTIVTISTIGYGDIHPTTTQGKILAIVIIVLGVAIFLGVVANATQLLLQRKQEHLRFHRTQTLIGLFFSELGNDLLNLCTTFDANIDGLVSNIIKEGNLVEAGIKESITSHKYVIDAGKMDVDKIKGLMVSKSELVLRLWENSGFNEDESFSGLIRSIFHLREELLAREDIPNLPASDIEHLANDLARVYPLLASHWVDYILYLKNNYTYLHSLAMRKNPFLPVRSAIIKK